MRKAVAFKEIIIRLCDNAQSTTHTVSFFGSSLLLETLSSKATSVKDGGANVQEILHYCKYTTTV